MTAQDLIAALDLPDSCRVDRRVPKKLLIENGAPNASDKRQINDVIEDIVWLAALKPNTIGVPEYRDDVREYLEIAVLSVTLKANAGTAAKPAKLAELVHRAVPYPMVLLLRSEQSLVLSLAHKRQAQNDAGKIILDGAVIAVTLPEDAPSQAVETAFLHALALRRQPQATLYALHEGWIDRLHTLLAAKLTGAFKDADSPEQAAARRAALHHCGELDAKIISLRLAASKEKQMARQVTANLEIKRLEADFSAAKDILNQGI